MKAMLQRRLPLLTTGAIFAALFIAAGLKYEGFFSSNVAVNLFTDNAVLGLTAIGMTLVIFAGGIDLSVGAVAGFTSIFVATLIEQHGVHPALAGAAALAIGGALGAGMGAIIHWFKQPAFLITLAGMFLMRGCAFWLNTESVGINHPLYARAADIYWEFGPVGVPLVAAILAVGLIIGGVIGHTTRFGRNLLALGGNEQSALLMGLPVGASKVGVYAFSGFCAAAAGLVGTLYTGSGNPSTGIGLELDAIAVVVIGGTVLTGGRGHMLGTVFGLLIFGTIQSVLLFDGRLSPWWARILVGVLLLAFILLQRGLVRAVGKGK
ncbi:Inner membrane ABC transporter permease protein YjfF [Lacunisphaera limnophila]|uniref:Inner membrane ABC transporter permease protein YjfF n=1 Tax=Lacunisphaera limnophila TaxID=1838286 RepID=A0A1D8AZQ9_9BACT|nr:galactofuranose ABC transporter, permease protein YjfF [Lacunisphaera limnophila]AOS46365.1 Inner membrane ABC transporter permease protein YjfF [Lacunisphaera limnophila]